MAYEIESCLYLPNDFFDKNVNETFIKLLIENALSLEPGDWIKGNPNKFEPDYFHRNIPFEFTIASDRKNNNVIRKLRNYDYTSDNLEEDVIKYISESIQAKAKKKYSVNNVCLCVLCILDMFNWISDKYGCKSHSISEHIHLNFFKDINNRYIDTEKFANIFIIFPDPSAIWWVCDIKSGEKIGLQLTDKMIFEKKYPFLLLKLFSDLLEGYLSSKN